MGQNVGWLDVIFNELDKRSEATLKAYVDKVIRMYHNRDQYFDKDAFILENGTVLKAYSVYGPIELTEENGEVKVTITLDGANDNGSKVTLQKDDKDAFTVTSGKTYFFNESVTMTAEAAGNDEFLYWVNAETNRIFTTEQTLTFDTMIDRDIKAVFVSTQDDDGFDNALATFTNTSGHITAAFSFEPDGETIEYADLVTAEPFLPGYTFTKWGYSVDNSYIDLAAADADAGNAYKSGSSVFAVMGEFYDDAGYALPVHDDCTSYIVMPEFVVGDDTAVITFTDSAAETVYTANMHYGYITTVTAAGDNFSYWADANTGEIVCFNKEFTYQCVANRLAEPKADFIAVYGGDNSAFYAARIAVKAEEADRVTLYAERTVKEGYTIKSTGVVFGVNGNSAPEVNAPDTLKGTSKNNANNGLYIVYISNARVALEGTVYARPYIEIEGLDEPVYGELITITQ